MSKLIEQAPVCLAVGVNAGFGRQFTDLFDRCEALYETVPEWNRSRSRSQAGILERGVHSVPFEPDVCPRFLNIQFSSLRSLGIFGRFRDIFPQLIKTSLWTQPDYDDFYPTKIAGSGQALNGYVVSRAEAPVTAENLQLLAEIGARVTYAETAFGLVVPAQRA